MSLIVATALSVIPRSDARMASIWQSESVFAHSLQPPGPRPNYIGPEFEIFSGEGVSHERTLSCRGYPNVFLSAAYNGWPFAVFEVKRQPDCGISVGFAPVGLLLNYFVALAVVGPVCIWLRGLVLSSTRHRFPD